MARFVLVAVLTLLASACAVEPSYVVRLNLEQIATATAAKDTAPGFASLGH